jgi:hypothetical protein
LEIFLQELLWHIVNNVNIPASRAPLFVRSPFLEFESIVPEKSLEMMISSAPDEEKRKLAEATTRNSVDYAAQVHLFYHVVDKKMSFPVNYRYKRRDLNKLN